jgi:hypothetical protein
VKLPSTHEASGSLLPPPCPEKRKYAGETAKTPVKQRKETAKKPAARLNMNQMLEQEPYVPAAAGQPGPLPAASPRHESAMLDHSYSSSSSRADGKPRGTLSSSTFFRCRKRLVAILASYGRQDRMELVLCMAGCLSNPTLGLLSPLCPGKLQLAISTRDLTEYLESRSVWYIVMCS